MSTVFSGLMCHAPIVIPAVAGRKADRCVRTTRAMREVALRAVASRPDRIVVVSPHTARHLHEWGAWPGRVQGDLARFRTPHLAVDLPPAPEVTRALDAPPSPREPLDHGAMVPLHFLWEAGWRGPTAVLALPWQERPGATAEDLGRKLAHVDGRTAVIASGDMSHRLVRGAPAGYHPDAQAFDAAFVSALCQGDWPAAVQAPHRQDAAEDVVDSSRVAMAAAGGPLNAEVLSYEGPWGVGYTEAVFHDPEPPLFAVARLAVDAHLAGRPFALPDGGPGPAGAFVTLRKDGELRGCIGHIEPTCPRLLEEVAIVARAAATRDPRFRPVTSDELDAITWEVSILEPPEPIDDKSALDPAVYGVIVTHARDPMRRGLLLPDIEGIDTVDQQVRIARRKGGIPEGAPLTLERFRVVKVAQP